MRLIDADALIEVLNVKNNCEDCDYQQGIFCSRSSDFVNACEAIFDAPTIEPERKKGKWIETSDGTMCGNCHKFPYDDGEYHIANWYSDFCPNCGADMRGEDA